MIIDGHGHACGEYLTLESIVKQTNSTKVDKVILLPGELNSKKTYKFSIAKNKGERLTLLNRAIRIVTFLSSSTKKLKEGNRYVYSITQKLPQKIIQFYWLTKSNFGFINEDYNEMKFKGLKLHQCWEYFKINSEFFNNVVNWAEKKELPIIIHFYTHKDVLDLIDFVKNRKVKIIVAHLFGAELFQREWKSVQENIFFDISNCYWVSQKRLEMAVEIFGSSKLLFGSDTPFGQNCIENTINQVKSLKLSVKEDSLILGDNMRALLGI